MIFAASIIGLLLICLVLSPFVIGKGGTLAEASAVDSVPQLKALKDSLVKRYLQDEAAFKKGEISKSAWETRREFLLNRYIDAARRQDFLSGMSRGGSSGGGVGL